MSDTALTSKQISTLKGIAQRTEPMIKVGKSGVTEGFIKTLDGLLSLHELVKIRFDDFKDEKKSLSARMAEKTGSQLIWIVGHVAVFYRAQPDPEKRRIHV